MSSRLVPAALNSAPLRAIRSIAATARLLLKGGGMNNTHPPRTLAALITVTLLSLGIPAMARAQESARSDASLRASLETGVSVVSWRATYRFRSDGFPVYESSSSCPAAPGSSTRLGLTYPLGSRAELGGFIVYEASRPSRCSQITNERHKMHMVTLGPAVTLWSLHAPRLFFRLGVGATLLRGEYLASPWTPRGVGASADIGYELVQGPRASLVVTGGVSAGVGSDSLRVNPGMENERRESVRASRVAGTLRLGAVFR